MRCTACGELIGQQPYEPIEIKFRANNHCPVEDKKAADIFARILNQDALLCLKCASKIALILGGTEMEVKDGKTTA